MLQIYRAMLRLLPTPLLALALAAHAQNFDPPAPYGGDQAVKWLFDQEMKLPDDLVQKDIDGNVTLSFIVQASGNVASMIVSGPLEPRIDAEVLRVGKLIRWHPASVGGSILDQQHSLTVPVNTKKYRKLHAHDKAATSFNDLPADSSGELLQGRALDSLAVPMIPRGLRGLPAYFSENLRYPEDARRRDIQGKVALEFVVETSGTVSNLRATAALGAGCDDEAMRLVRSVPWRPAFKGGRRVRSIVTMEVQFRLDPSQRP